MPETRSAKLASGGRCSRTCGAFSGMAAMYQASSSTASTLTIGSAVRCHPAGGTSVIAVAGAECVPHPLRDGEEARRFAETEIAFLGYFAFDHVDDSAW